jgi:hypothetical protein
VGDYLFVADGLHFNTQTALARSRSYPTPDDVGIVSLDIINGYIICVVSNSQRCYWINPGELVIDPLNFFEAERAPDHLLQVRTATDQFWLLGQKTTEVWRMTGNGIAPFQRIEGRCSKTASGAVPPSRSKTMSCRRQRRKGLPRRRRATSSEQPRHRGNDPRRH